MNEFERITDLTTVSLALKLLRDMKIGSLGNDEAYKLLSSSTNDLRRIELMLMAKPAKKKEEVRIYRF